jgi:predicted ATPase
VFSWIFFNPGERTMTGPTMAELNERIAMIRQNINDLVEQATAYSGAEDENRTADRIEDQQRELARLIELRDVVLRE